MIVRKSSTKNTKLEEKLKGESINRKPTLKFINEWKE